MYRLCGADRARYCLWASEEIMKFYKWNKHYLGWGITAFIVIVASMLVLMTLVNIEKITTGIGNFAAVISPIVYGFIIAYLLAPIVEAFEKKIFGKIFKKSGAHYEEAHSGNEKYAHLKVYVKNKPARICSITLTFLLIIGILVGIGIAIIPQLTNTLSLLVDNIPEYLKTLNKWISDTFSNYPEIEEELTSTINNAGTTLRNFLTTQILPKMGDYLSFLTNSIAGIVGLVLNIIFGMVVAIYCLYSKELFAAQAKKTVYAILGIKRANSLISSLRKIHRSFGNFITGTIIDSFVVGCFTFIVTTLSGVPFSLLVSVIMGITNIIPYFGPFIGIVPCLILIFMENPFMCIVFTVIVLIIQNLNGNVISPRILGESTGLTSFWVIFAILVGQGIFGFWGLIIGIPLFAVIYSAARTFVSEKLEKRGLPSGSDEYTDIESFSGEDAEPVSLAETTAAEQKLRAEKEAAAKAEKKKKLEERRSKLMNGLDKIKNRHND